MVLKTVKRNHVAENISVVKRLKPMQERAIKGKKFKRQNTRLKKLLESIGAQTAKLSSFIAPNAILNSRIESTIA